MVPYLVCVIGCLFVIIALAVYFPIIYTRKTNKILDVLHEIEANSHKQEGSK
jgi:hypothetical protein